MSVKVSAYIGFKDNAKEAAEFYKSIFGGELYMDTMGKYSDNMPMADEDKDLIMHGYLKGDNGLELMMADTPSSMEFREGSRITLALNGDDENTLREYWDKLVEGGNVTIPLSKAPWGDTFGMLVDKFGVNWMVDIGPVQG